MGMRIIFDIIHSGDLVFDVGANYGKKAEIFKSLGASVVCFEPLEECASFLRGKGFTVDNVALSDHIGTVDFYVGSAHTLSTISDFFIEKTRVERFSGYNWNKKITVESSTLDRAIDQYGIPSFCKIDVEGAEYTVLKGMTRALPVLSFEFTPELVEQNTAPCIDRLMTLGNYEFNFSEGESNLFKYQENVGKEEILSFLRSIHDYKVMFGDVYAFLKG